MSMDRRGFLQAIGATSVALVSTKAVAQILGDGPPIHLNQEGIPLEVDAVTEIKALEAARWRAMVDRDQLYREGWPKLTQMLKRAAGPHPGVIVKGSDPEFPVDLVWRAERPESVLTAGHYNWRFKNFRQVVDDSIIQAYRDLNDQGMKFAQRWRAREEELEQAIVSHFKGVDLQQGNIRFCINGRDYYMSKHPENPYLMREHWPEYCPQEVVL